MKVSVIVPWRTDNGQRERVWNRIRPLWEDSEFEVVTGTPDDGPFNCSQALNRAAEKATGDVLVTMGADHWPDLDAVATAARLTSYASWMPVYGGVHYLSQGDTDAVIAGADPARFRPERTDPCCQGITAITRQSWQDIGGMDERYAGWGYEDTALLRELARRYGFVPAPFNHVIGLWHDGAHRDLSPNNPNRALFEST
jgi:GT2 family glycosyltransferase